MWNQHDAIELCCRVEELAPTFGCHVALTGGCLYKPGERKDCDLLFYRIRQRNKIEMDELFRALEKIGVTRKSGFGWCYKMEFLGKPVDFLFPEEPAGVYKK